MDTSMNLNSTGICDTTNISSKVVRRKKRLKVTSTHNSTLCRNTTLNSTVLKQTLKSNNRALAKCLEQIRFELAQTQKLLLKEKEEKQKLHMKYTTLYKLVGLKDEGFEAEVDRRMQLRMKHMKENLNSILGNVQNTVDLLQKCMLICNPHLSRDSSLSGHWGQDMDSPPDKSYHIPKGSVSHQGSSAQPGTSVDKSQDSVESEDDSANHRKIPKDVLHQALDVILEQSGLGDSLMFSEDAGSRRNSKKSRPNSTTGSRRSSRRSSQLLGSVGRKSGEVCKTAEEDMVTDDHLTESHGQEDNRDPECPVLRGDDRPIVSKFAPHIQGNTPASSPVRMTPVNQDDEEFYSRFIPVEGSSSNKGTPKSSKSKVPTGLGKKDKKNEFQPRGQTTDNSHKVSGKNKVATPENRETALSTAAGSVVDIVPEEDTKDVDEDDVTAMHKESEEKEVQQQATTVKSSEKHSKGPSVVDKRGTFVLKEAPVKPPEVSEPERVNNNKKEKSGKGKSSKTAAADKRGTFVLEKRPVLSEESENEEKVTRKTARRVRRGTFAITKEGKKEMSDNTQMSSGESKQARLRRGTFCIQNEKTQEVVAGEEGILGERDSLLMDTSIIVSHEPGSEESVRNKGDHDDDTCSESHDVATDMEGLVPVGSDLEMYTSKNSADKLNANNKAMKGTNRDNTYTEADDLGDNNIKGVSRSESSVKADDAMFKVPFPVTKRQEVIESLSSTADHTICEEEEMEMTEVLTSQQVESFEGKVPLPSFITRENSMEPAFLKEVSLETNEQKENVTEEKNVEKEDRGKKEASKKRENSSLKKVKDISGKKGPKVRGLKDGGNVQKVGAKDQQTTGQRAGEKIPSKDQTVEKAERGSKAVYKGQEVEDDILGTDVEAVPKKKPRYDSESDSSDGGKVRKHFNTFVSKPGKIMFKSGRKDVAEISTASKNKKSAYKAKSILPRATLKTTASKLKGKLLPSTSPLNSSRTGHAKNVFDLSLNESIPVPSSISYGQFLEQKTIKDQQVSEPDHQTTEKGGDKVMNQTVTEHGIMLVLGNGKRTKPRRNKSKGVSYATELTEDHLITPAGEVRVESRIGEADGKNTVTSKKKEFESKKSAGHTPPRKPLDSKQRKKLAESITKHNQSENSEPLKDGQVTRQPQLNQSLFTAEDSTSEDQPLSPSNRRLSSPRTSVTSPIVELERINLRVTPETYKSKNCPKQTETPTTSGHHTAHRKSRRDSSVKNLTKHYAVEESDSSSPVRTGSKKTLKHPSSHGDAGRKKIESQGLKESSKKRVSQCERNSSDKNIVTDSSEDEYHPGSHGNKIMKKKKVKKGMAQKIDRKKVLVEESDEEVTEETPGGEKACKEVRVDTVDNRLSDSEEEPEKVICRKKHQSKVSANRAEQDRVMDTDEEYAERNWKEGREQGVKARSVEKRKKSKDGEGRKEGRKNPSSSGAPAEYSASEEVARSVKDRKRTKEKKSKSAVTIPLPVDLEQIKTEKDSFLEDPEENREEYEGKPQEESPCTGRRSRRGAGAVSYKEPSLTSKLRRGDTIAQSVYSGKDAPSIYKGKKEAKKSTGRRQSVVDRKRSALVTIGNTLTET